MERAAKTRAISVENLSQVGGEGLTHPLDANTFVLDDSVLIECGSRFGYPQLVRQLGNLGIKVASVKTVLATHGHFDHVSGMELLSLESDAKLFVPTEDAVGVESGATVSTVAYYYEQEALPIKVDGVVDNGFCLETDTARITAIKTPWHTPGSVCYTVEQDKSTTLIAADTLYGFYFPTPGRSMMDDIKLGRESLRRLQENDYDYIAIGHAMMGFRDDVATRLEEAARQFAPEYGLEESIEKQLREHPAYVNLWRKMSNQQFRY